MMGASWGYGQTILNNIDMKLTGKNTRDIVNEFYKYTSERNVDGLTQIISEDIIWNLSGNKELAPWLGERKGKGQVREFFSLLNKYTKSREFRINQLFIEGNKAVAIGYLSSEMLVNNQVFESFFIAYFTIENQRISDYLFVEDSWKLVEVLGSKKASSDVEIIKLYFASVSSKDIETVNSLFAKDIEAYFPHFGVIKGFEEWQKLNKNLNLLIETIHYDTDSFIYSQSDNRVIVEGVESGIYKDGKVFTNKRFCSVFEIANNTITRMYVYPNLTF